MLTIESLKEQFLRAVDLDTGITSRLLVTLEIVLVIFLIRWLVLALVYRRVDDVRIRYHWKKISQYVAVTAGILLIGVVWFEGFKSAATYFGILSAGLAIALKDLVANFVGWAFILWRRPFEVGDRIQVGDVAGDVIDLRIFQFTILEIGNWVDADQSTGRVIHINNGAVFTQSLANFTRGFQHIWNEVPVLVTFESDWKKAKALLSEIAHRHGADMTEVAEERIKQASRRFMIYYSKLTPTVYTTVKDCGVLLTIRYLCDPKKRRSSEQAIWEHILEAFAASDDIDFAYPTQRFYDNVAEGKPGTKPPLPQGR
jgi:small-conductance mechanosensitive channel